ASSHPKHGRRGRAYQSHNGSSTLFPVRSADTAQCRPEGRTRRPVLYLLNRICRRRPRPAEDGEVDEESSLYLNKISVSAKSALPQAVPRLQPASHEPANPERYLPGEKRGNRGSAAVQQLPWPGHRTARDNRRRFPCCGAVPLTAC